jgi:geranylgeranyl reductase family protein
MTKVADLIVVGAGPAGSATAYHAAKSGLDVALLDRQHFPRDKPCGDGLLPHARKEIRLMGLGDWLDGPGHGVFDGYSIYGRKAVLTGESPPDVNGKRGYVIPRAETDQALLERARQQGAHFFGGVKARGLLHTSSGKVAGVEASAEGGSSGRLHFEAPLVVVADGVGGFAREGLKNEQNGVAIRQYFAAAKGSRRNHVHFWMTENLTRWGAAYGWLFYLGDSRANVGVAIYKDVLQRSPHPLKEMYENFLREASVAERLDGAEPDGPAKSWSLKTGMLGAKRYGQGVMLVGDAGSMIHPLSGEGVGYAIESGRLAAHWAYEAHAREDFSPSLLRGYERELQWLRGRQHEAGLRLVRLHNRFPKVDLLEHLFAVCERDEDSLRTLARIFYGETSVYALLNHPRALSLAAAGAASSALRKVLP